MTEVNMYLLSILNKYAAKDLTPYFGEIVRLKTILQTWAQPCFLQIIDSGSRAKGTAISLASDVDYLVSLSKGATTYSGGGLKEIYNSLFSCLANTYAPVRKQNVSVRISLGSIQKLEVDITPARKHLGYTNDHSLYASKSDSWVQTNIQTHIQDISQSGRINEIKLLKIWRELNLLEFPSIYIEYLLITKILRTQSKHISDLGKNFWHILNELAKDTGNPLFARIPDPANTSNVLSDLLTQAEKNKIIAAAKQSIQKKSWDEIVS